MNTASFKNYWVNTKGYYFTQVTNSSQAIPGNTFFWLASDAGETYNHNMLIVDVDENGNVVVNMHTGNKEEYPWSLNNTLNDAGTGVRKFYTIDFAHNFSAASQDSSTHVQTCTLCGTTVTGNHDDLGEPNVYEETHALTCSVCNYVWPTRAHNKAGERTYNSTTHTLTCSACNYVHATEEHDKNGPIQKNVLRHAYDCRWCDYVWPWENHDNEITSSSTEHTYTCSICEYSRSEAHTFVSGSCSVCGYREGVIWEGIVVEDDQ